MEDGNFNGEDRKMLHDIDKRQAVLETKLTAIARWQTFVSLTVGAAVIAAVMNLVLKS